MKAVLAQAETYCVCIEPQKIMQYMHGIIQNMFDCWANPDVHLLLLKSSMGLGIVKLASGITFYLLKQVCL